MLFTRNNATAKTTTEDKTMFGSGSSVPHGTRRKLMKAAISRLNQARKNLAGFPCTPRSKFARTSLRALAATGMCFSMAFATVAVPAISDVTAVTAEAASGWAAKSMSCSVTGKAKKIVVKWDKLSGAKKYKVQRKEKGGSWKTLTTVSSSKTKYADSTAKSGKTYFYKVTAYNGKKWTKGTKSAAVSLTGSSSSKNNADKNMSAEDKANAIYSPFTNSYIKDSYGQYPWAIDMGGQDRVASFFTGITASTPKLEAATIAAKNIAANTTWKHGTCTGYAAAFELACVYLGIDCVEEQGTGSAGRNHLWNRVTIDGVSYWYDVFMYDYNNSNGAYPQYLASSARFPGYTWKLDYNLYATR